MGLITALVHFHFGVSVLGEGLFGLIGNGSYADLVAEWYLCVLMMRIVSMCAYMHICVYIYIY